MRFCAALLFAAIATGAQAQQQPVNPQEQIERTIGGLVISNLHLQAQLTQAQAQLSALMKQIEEQKVTPKPEPSQPAR